MFAALLESKEIPFRCWMQRSYFLFISSDTTEWYWISIYLSSHILPTLKGWKSLVIQKTEVTIWSSQLNLSIIIWAWNGGMPITSDPHILFHKTERSTLTLSKTRTTRKTTHFSSFYALNTFRCWFWSLILCRYCVNDCCRLHPPMGGINIPEPVI